MIKMLLPIIVIPLAQQTAPAPDAQPSRGGSPMMMILFYGLLLAAMYFLLFAPQRKKQKEQQKMIASLAPGDEVLTAGGIYGEITSVRPDRLVVRIGDNTKVEVEKGFVQAVTRKAGGSQADKK